MTSTPLHPVAITPISITAVARLTNAVSLSGAVRGALRSGLLEALWRWQPCTVDELAVRAHLQPRAVELTLHALGVGGVTTQDGELWSTSAEPEGWAAVVGFEEHVCTYIETGHPTRADQEDRYAEVLSVIGRFHETIAERMAPSIVKPGAKVLELAAGTAPWSRALLAVEPTATADAVDLAPVIARLRSQLDGDPRASRITLLAGDVRRLVLPDRYDVIVVAGLCRLLSDGDNASLLAQCGRWLATAGQLIVCDALSGTPDPHGSLALYALGLAARSRAETLWSVADFDRWVSAGGLVRTASIATDRPEVSVLTYAHADETHDIHDTGHDNDIDQKDQPS